MTQRLPWAGRKDLRIAVIGDVILDEYLDGQVTRISPEAPVPVHLVSRTFHGAGGAANAARNIKLAGGEVTLLSVCGDDDAGRDLRQILEEDGIGCDHLITVADRPTVRKTRITANSQQMVRVDRERTSPVDAKTQDSILATLDRLKFDALLISDYGKGTLPIRLLSNVLELAASRKVPSVVDPKGRDYSKYLHASLVTPNRNEACDALGLDPAADHTGEELGRRLQQTFGLKNILVTMGAKGMALVPEPKERTISLPAVAKEVYDVSGAGDTVCSMMALAMGAGASLESAMQIATTAAAIVVEKWRTQPIMRHELEAALQTRSGGRWAHASEEKIADLETTVTRIEELKSQGKRIVFTNGCFDILHAGHVSYLEEAKSLGEILVVAVNDDASVRRLKGDPRPFIQLDNRQRVLAGLGCVDLVLSFSGDTPYEVIKRIVPHVLVKGADWEKKDIIGADIVAAAGGEVETIKYLSGLSTTAIVSRIRGT